MKTTPIHTFHIPVMGLAYTIDSPIRVAHLGISSVISVMDDELIERLNKLYSEKFELPYKEIGRKVEDFRAKRITAYLDTVDTIVKEKFSNFKKELLDSKKRVTEFLNVLPDSSILKEQAEQYVLDNLSFERFKEVLESYFKPGSIDVNIMTKVDREQYNGKEVLPSIYSDAHAALRGFAESKVQSSLILSAGMNPRLFSYFESFDVFYPQQHKALDKKIVLKVSDYRSALIQGSFLAKKGIWVSEYRVESGLNCGGHAFATDGFLLGPIMAEFKNQRQELIATTHKLLCNALEEKQRYTPEEPLELKITVQGGIGTAEEHQFLLDTYEVDSVGWGSPFLLVPEATSVDVQTRKLLADAKEKDLYLSSISPLGIPFNTVRGTTNEAINKLRNANEKYGSSCPRKYLALDKTHSIEGWCTASKKYQTKEIKALKDIKSTLSDDDYISKIESITEKSCLCIGLANASLMEQNLPIKGEAQGVVVCPGPNMAYFDKEVSLEKMIQHIYGKENVMKHENRPNFLIKELEMYREHFKKELSAITADSSVIAKKKLEKLKNNILNGIDYYKNLFENTSNYFQKDNSKILKELERIKMELSN
ncbi:hypothetical protein [Myroides guanonis]|uniref:Uncharacterized protein n=1 Tax=Myroides guanonis TaxID=1150112 RepID=A0A1I3R9R6_9FLAO|nr:hypothetical protein [Myroides guanonis]SFJ42409.1 hypothetical protein SAMN04487893_10783 [Myroides guanonis]